MKFILINSDQRMQYLGQQLGEKLELVVCKNSFDVSLAINEEEIDGFILPPGSLDEDGGIRVQDQKIRILDLMQSCKKPLWIFCANWNERFLQPDWTIVNYGNNFHYKAMSAELTAQGIISWLIMNTPCNINEYHYDVLGYGACGKAIVKWLLRNECQVRLVSNQIEIQENCCTLSYQEYNSRQPHEIVIVASNRCVLNEKISWRSHPLILDISHQGIATSLAAQKQGDYYLLSCLPSTTGAQSMADCLFMIIEKELGL